MATTKDYKPHHFLQNMLRLIEKGWCKGPLATDKRGRRVSFRDPEACRFCVVGAEGRTELQLLEQHQFRFAKRDKIRSKAVMYRMEAQGEIGCDIITTRGSDPIAKSTVVKTLRHAIKLAKAAGD